MLNFIDTLDFTVLAVIAASLVALMTSYLGVLVVLRRIAFVGATLAQLATAGIAMAGLLEIPCNLGAIIMMLLGVGYFAQQENNRYRLPSEGMIGAAYVAAGAMAVLFMALAPHTDSDMLALLFGNILAVSAQDILLMASALVLITVVNILFYKQFMLTAFDPMMAQAIGYKVKFWNWLFYITLGLAIAVAIHTAGVLLVFSMLVLPPLTALTLSRRWGLVWIYSTVSSLAAVAGGVWLSIQKDLPTAASIIAVSCSLFIIALIYKKVISMIKPN
ncbi:metal ABC transporter permease [bacterium]|nr:metal ABC transporter permease [bacterium]